jgi:adenylate cyclase class IV
MRTFEQITAQTILNRLNSLDNEVKIIEKLGLDPICPITKRAELYLLAANIFGINECININSLATNYFEIEIELKTIIGE